MSWRTWDRKPFSDWVVKWRIGPGMNDSPRIDVFLEELKAGRFTAEHFGVDNLTQQQLLLREGLYSGFDGPVGPGWVPILDRLAADLVAMGWDRDLRQVKEKFGTLRFYIGRGTVGMEARIAEAERESAITCEECGGAGAARGGSWIRTLCEACCREEERR